IVFKGRGIQLVGPLPKELENLTTYAAGVLSDAADADLARQFVSFIKTKAARNAFEETGVSTPKD
ncbi:MAG: substrate-binding domain-containing protein, partial [Rhodospirillales bacterium]